MTKKLLIAGVIAATSFSSCASIISGTTQTIKFTSSPPAAIVFLNDVQMGITPMELTLKRKNEYNVKIKLEGFKTYEVNLEQDLNPWYLGNILFGGLIGLVVDPITGAVYDLSPDKINAELEKSPALETPVVPTPTVSTVPQNHVNVALSSQINPDWKKIGQLERL
jgi:PEGA domain